RFARGAGHELGGHAEIGIVRGEALGRVIEQAAGLVAGAGGVEDGDALHALTHDRPGLGVDEAEARAEVLGELRGPARRRHRCCGVVVADDDVLTGQSHVHASSGCPRAGVPGYADGAPPAWAGSPPFAHRRSCPAARAPVGATGRWTRRRARRRPETGSDHEVEAVPDGVVELLLREDVRTYVRHPVAALALPLPTQPEGARAEAGLAHLEPVAMIQPCRRDGLPRFGAAIPLAGHRLAVAAELDLEQDIVRAARHGVH